MTHTARITVGFGGEGKVHGRRYFIFLQIVEIVEIVDCCQNRRKIALVQFVQTEFLAGLAGVRCFPGGLNTVLQNCVSRALAHRIGCSQHANHVVQVVVSRLAICFAFVSITHQIVAVGFLQA